MFKKRWRKRPRKKLYRRKMMRTNTRMQKRNQRTRTMRRKQRKEWMSFLIRNPKNLQPMQEDQEATLP